MAATRQDAGAESVLAPEMAAAQQAEALAAKLAGSGPAVRAFPSLQEAVAGVVRQSPPGRILVTGTLYAYKDLF
jgi:shikimate kinase